MNNYDMEELRRINYIELLRDDAFKDIAAYTWQFSNADMTAEMQKAKRYAEEWDSFRREGTGLIFIGDTWRGKSYAAGCIANELLKRMLSVRFVRMVDVVSYMQRCYGDELEKYFKHLMSPELLIIDDLGVERDTAFAQECVYEVIEHRIATGKPMIITTNIPLQEMQGAKCIGERRIYSRILSYCVPVLFDGIDFREHMAKKNMIKVNSIMNNDQKEKPNGTNDKLCANSPEGDANDQRSSRV